jgi:MGT family glycosyltransferase
VSRRFLLLTLNAAGNWPPERELARALVERGHAVRVVSDPAHAAEARAAGADFRPYRIALRRPRPGEPAPTSELDFVLRRWFLNPEFCDELLEEIAAERPDAVLVDAMLLAAFAGAEHAGVPAAALWHTLYGTPTMRPAQGELLAPLHALRERLGLPPLGERPEAAEARADAVLAFTYEAFDTPPEPRPAWLSYVGPLACVARSQAPYTGPWRGDDLRPLVVVSYSTSPQGQEPLLQRVVDALGGLPVRGLVTRGPAVPEDALRLPQNVASEAFVSHASALREASLVVTHAGHGTVMAAVTAGVPLLCTPMGRDQPDVARHVELRGLGAVVSPGASCEELGAAIARALADDALAERARRFAAGVDAEAGRRLAVDLLERLAAHAAARPR